MNQEINQTTPPQQPNTGFSTNELIRRVLDIFKAPVFENDFEKNRKARILNGLLITLFIVMLFYLFAILLTNESPLGSLIIVSLVMALVGGCYIANKRGAVEVTAHVFVLSMWVMMMLTSVLFGQAAFNPLFPVLLIVVTVAGFLLSLRFSISIGVLTIFFIILFYFADQNMVIPQVLEVTEIVSVSRIVMALMFTTFLTAVAISANNQITKQIRHAEEELLTTNSELEDIRSYLEQEVLENTHLLERRSRYLEAAAKVAGASLSTQNLEEMLENVVNEVSHLFDFFHVGIFMLDEQNEWAALRAASSEGGKRMIARNHRLAVGRQGIVGFVTSLGQGRISQDTGDDRVHEPAEELPETRSEMALPLIARGEIIGALDIQDTKPEAFTEDDITVLQTMADQIALAIENIRLYAQTQETLEEVRRLFGEYSQQAWHDVHQKNLLSSYRYFSGSVTKVMGEVNTEMTETTVSIPVEVRGVKLGAIEISKGEENANWTDDELKLLTALSEQLGIALDSARLFNESQLRATTEHAISEINSQLWETMDINAILRTTAANLRETLALPELTIRMAAPDDKTEASSNGNLEPDEIEVND